MNPAWLETITQMPTAIYLKWLMLFLVFGVLWFWLQKNNRALSAYLDRPSPDLNQRLFAMLRARGWVLLGLWVMLGITLMVVDVRYPPVKPPEGKPPQPVSSEAAPMPLIASDTRRALEEANLDALKSRMEDAFLSFYYLHQCKSAEISEYQALHKGFYAQLLAENIDPALLEDSVSAAIGSYETVYSGASCQTEHLAPVRQQFTKMLESLSNFTAPVN